MLKFIDAYLNYTFVDENTIFDFLVKWVTLAAVLFTLLFTILFLLAVVIHYLSGAFIICLFGGFVFYSVAYTLYQVVLRVKDDDDDDDE